MKRLINFFNLIKYINLQKDFYNLVLLSLISNIFEMFGFVMIIPLTMTFMKDGFDSIGVGYLDYLINLVVNNYFNINPLILILFLISIFFFLKLFIYSYSNYKIFLLAQNIGSKIANKVFLFELEKKYSDQHQLGSSDKIRKTLYDTLHVSKATSGLVMIISEVMLFILVFIVFVTIENKLFFSLLILFVLSLFYIHFSKKFVLNASKSQQQKYSYWLKFLQETFGGIKMIKLNNSEFFFSKIHNQITENYFKEEKKLNYLYLLPKIFFETLLIIFFILIIFFSKIILNIPNTFILPILALLAITAIRLIPSIYKIVINYQNIVQAEPYLKNLYDIWSDSTSIKKATDEISENRNIIFNNKIEIQNVSFGYVDNNLILKNINLTIEKSKIVGIYGSSGSGKTTFIDLLSGLIQPNSGKILVDSMNISSSIKEWQKKIGYVSQDTYIIDDNLENNIIFSKKILVDHQYLEEIITLLNLKNLLLDYYAGERGSKLSGGQKQKIGIARALVDKPDLLILDEFTSSLDENSENDILSVINDINKKFNTTIIMISHRKNPFKICDKIFKLNENNCLVEESR